ncbi:SRPBCC family protein [Streptacidiphilus fuscans]|uniref:SRPBCC family protein n=1 Tax=Streptacidiphilus fuscans TaxID=2789292 RepID=A0A931B608_9ACTN|nr:SRPBCC family protein [Streptacidiphilus fuscans]MBF9068498.1 SRPBCC family protein [Streptacidiphilus fuscans]
MTTEFLESAPVRVVAEERLTSGPDALFRELTDDASTWPSWFGAIRRASYTGPPPYGVGAGRAVKLVGGIRFVESVLVWEEPRRFVYRIEETNLLGAHAWLEEWLLTPDGDGTSVRFTMAIEGHAMIELPTHAARSLVERSCRTAMHKLDARAGRRAQVS